MKLLRNVNGERFEEMNVFEALPFDVEVNRHGLWKKAVPAKTRRRVTC